MRRVLYFCVGCRQVHYDEDFCESDGDLEIIDWEKFTKSIFYCGFEKFIDKLNELGETSKS